MYRKAEEEEKDVEEEDEGGWAVERSKKAGLFFSFLKKKKNQHNDDHIYLYLPIYKNGYASYGRLYLALNLVPPFATCPEGRDFYIHWIPWEISGKRIKMG